MNRELERLAQRLESDPAFLSAALAAYVRATGVTMAAAAKSLGCSPETLTLVRLCRMPALQASEFRRGIERITAEFAVRANVLAEMTRLGQVLLRLQGQEPSRPALLAARDRARPRGRGGSP